MKQNPAYKLAKGRNEEIKMKKIVLALIVFFASVQLFSQCPQVYNYLGTPTTNPNFISCSGSAYAMSIQSPSSWGTYTINWGDASSLFTAASYATNSTISHTYASTTNTYNLNLIIPSLSCTMIANVEVGLAANPTMTLPVSTICAPGNISFSVTCAGVNANTTFTWNFGDGSPQTVLTGTSNWQNIVHSYTTGNCNTTAQLSAKNNCNFGTPITISNNGIHIYKKDDAQITIDMDVKCYPDNQFTFSNTTTRNCLTQGNTFQRQEKWNFGSYWGGAPVIIGWSPWPPSAPHTFTYPATFGSINSFTAQLLDSNICGVTSTLVSFFIVPSPTAALITPTGNLCQNIPITFTNSSSFGFDYTINYGDGGGNTIVNTGTLSHTYSTPGSYTVTLIAQLSGYSGSCVSTTTVVVTILSSPIANFSISPTSSCNVINNVTFANTSSNAVTYSWLFGNGNTSTLQIPPAQNYTTTGTFITTLNVVSSTGCVKSQTQSIIVRPLPLPNFAQFTTCVSAATTFTNNSTVTGTNPITSYTWNFGDGTSISTASAPVKTYTAPNTYTVKLKASTAFCLDSISKTVLVNVKPTAGFALSPTIACPPMKVTFTNTSINSTNYVWKFGSSPTATSSTTSTTTNFTYSNSNQSNANFTITLIASTGFGCADSIKKNITVKPRPVASFSASTIAGCAPLPNTFTSTSIGATSYLFDFGDLTTSTLPLVAHTFTNQTIFTQTYTTQLVAYNSVGCSDTTKLPITVYPTSLASFSPQPQAGCTPLTVNFPGISGVATYSWNHGDGSPTYTTLSSHTWSYANTGTTALVVTVGLTALTSNNCLGTNTNFITIYPKPIANFSSNINAGCTPFSANFINTSTLSNTNSWYLGNGTTANNLNAGAIYTNATGANSLTYTIKLKITSANSCLDSITKTISVYPQPQAKFTGDTSGCTPKLATFSNTSIGANSYSWKFGDGSPLVSTSGAVHQFTTVSPLSKTYSIQLTAISINNCKDSTINYINVHPKPSFKIVATPDSGCSPLKVFFPKIANVYSYQWSYSGVVFSSTANIYNTFENKTSLTKSFTVQLIAKDVFSCTDSTNKTIKVYQRPVANFQAAPLLVYLPNQGTEFTNLSTGASSYTWNFGDNTTSTVLNPEHVYSVAGTYSIFLIATNSKGCRDTFELPEKILAIDETSIVVPNAFTPNQNGSPGTYYDPKDKSNDVFHPNVRGVDKYTLSIYSRWGELLFETQDPDEGWDGYYKGKLCTQDVYVWKIVATFLDGKKFVKTGDLLLVR